MLVLLIVWVWMLLLFQGIGNVFSRVFFSRENGLSTSFLIGFIVYSVLTTIINFFFPTNFFVPLIISIFFHKGIYQSWILTFSWVKSLKLFQSAIITIIVLFSIIITNRTTGVFDSYLYHNSIINFSQYNKLIFGLANLHGRFGFNNLTYCLSATFMFGKVIPFYASNGLLLVVVSFSLLTKLINVSSWKRKLLLVYTLIWLFRLAEENISSPDLTLTLFVVYLFFDFLTNEFRIRPYHYLIICFIPTIKLSALIFSVVLLIGMALFSNCKFTELKKRQILILLILGFAFVGRSLILTGQLIYPFKVPYLEISKYGVSKETIENEIIGIDGWARFPGANYSKLYLENADFLQWFPKVWNANFKSKFTRLPIIGRISEKSAYSIFLFLFLISILINLKTIKEKKSLILALLLGFLFIVLNAPNARWFELYLVLLVFLSVDLYEGSRWKSMVITKLIVLTLLFVPYQFKRLVENSLERIVNLHMQDLLMPNNIENWFERKPIREQLSLDDGIVDYNTIFTKMDTINNVKDGNGFLYRYSFKSNGLSPWSEEVSVPYKLGENIVFDGCGFIDLKLKR
jgi:hypothetical protein